MNEYYFWIIGDPPRATAQQKGERVVNGTIQHYDKSHIKRAKDFYMWNIKPFAPTIPWNCPIEVEVIFYFEKKDIKRDERKLTRPDLDNSEKILFDCMTKVGFWRDDSLICRKITEKWYTKEGLGRVYIRIKEIGRYD